MNFESRIECEKTAVDLNGRRKVAPCLGDTRRTIPENKLLDSIVGIPPCHLISLRSVGSLAENAVEAPSRSPRARATSPSSV